MMKLRRWILYSLALAASPALACYTVYDRSDRVVYQSEKPPIDMSRQIHETLPERFPGGHLVFDGAAECPVISSVAAGTGARTVWSTAPLLTDLHTARAMNLPYAVMPGGIALIQPRDAVMLPGITVLPAAATAGVASTSVMGAGPGRGAVITELRDPPMTIEEAGGRVTIREPAR